MRIKREAITFCLDKSNVWQTRYTVKFGKKLIGEVRKEMRGVFTWTPFNEPSKETLGLLKAEAIKRRWYIANIELTEMDKNCLSKKTFHTSEKAMLSIFFNPTQTNIAPYKCSICRKWHLTKNKQDVETWSKKWDLKILTKRANEQSK